MKPLERIHGLRVALAAAVVLVSLFLGTGLATAKPLARVLMASGACQIVNLGTLPGQGDSLASDVNSLGQVVGVSGNRAFLWQSGAMTDIGTLPGGNSARALGINERGEIVGDS